MTHSRTASKEDRLPLIVDGLKMAHPDAHCELNYENALQLLVATILSAQCTDVRVNKVTPALFERYKDAHAFATADREELESLIRSAGFYRQKAKFIQESAIMLVQEHGGRVPDEMDQLLKLKGVARKTAGVVLGEIYGKAEGVVVDTHVKRLAKRLGLTEHDDPKKVEKDLMRLLPRDEWIMISHRLIFHGRRVCDARKPDCAVCTIEHLCPASQL